MTDSKLLSAALLASLLVAGCAGQPPNSLKTLDAPDRTALDGVRSNLAEESRKLRDNLAAMRAELEVPRPPLEAEAVPPVHDPLEDIVVSTALNDAPLQTLLKVLADESRRSLIVEPEVLAIDQRASLYLKEVTARELLDHIMDAFDLSARRDGSAIKIGLFDERLYNLDFLNTRMDLSVASGGNVFGAGGSGGNGGSGGSGGSNLIRGDFSLSGGTAVSTDPYEQLDASIKRIVGRFEKEGEDGDELLGRKARATYAINRSAGTLYVRARPSQLRLIDRLVDNLKQVASRQVLIEAQLLDVTLNDNFQFGVDWSLLRNHFASVLGESPALIDGVAAEFSGAKGLRLPARTINFMPQTVGTSAGHGLGIGYSNSGVGLAVNMLQGFGTVKLLSNPSIRVRNHTPAILSVGTTSRFVSQTRTTVNPSADTTVVSTEVQTDTLFSGVIVGVLPSIDDKGRVELLIHPMQSEVDQASLTPVDFGGGNKIILPQVRFKGITSTLAANDGDVIILGGLIDQTAANSKSGTPGVVQLPVLGNLFGAEDRAQRTRELVMVLRVKVL